MLALRLADDLIGLSSSVSSSSTTTVAPERPGPTGGHVDHPLRPMTPRLLDPTLDGRLCGSRAA